MNQPRNKFYTLIPLFIVLIIDTMGIALVLPLLGPIFTGKAAGFLPLHASTTIRDFWYGLTLAIFCIFMLFGAPFLGDLSDHVGRKKVLLICLFGTALGLAMSAIGVEAKSLLLLISGRAIAGFLCGSEAIAQATIVDISTKGNKAANLSLISLASCLGFVLGPALSGLVIHSGHPNWHLFAIPFWIAAGLALLNGSCLVFTLHETFKPKKTGKILLTKGIRIFVEAFTHKTVRKIATIFLIAELGWALYFQFIPLFLIGTYKYNTAQISHFMVWIGIVFSLSFLVIVPIATKHIKLSRLATISLLLAAIGISLGIVGNESLLWLSVVPASIGGAIFYMALLTLMSNAVDEHSQGWVMGIFASVAAVSWACGGIFCGFLGTLNIYLPFTFATILIIIGLLVSSTRI